MRLEDRERALTAVESRVVARAVAAAQAGGPPLDEVLAEAIYQETRRLREEGSSKRAEEDRAFWRDAKQRLGRSSERTQRELLSAAVRHYASEIVGNFDPRVYGVVSKAAPPALGLLLNAVSPKRLLGGFGAFPGLDDAVIVQGEVDHARRLQERGRLILVPTHVSNLDSPVIGFAILRMGLPPMIYGAGLNLFGNPMLGYFMHNLGAYTVDRKKADPLYKDVLKTYCAVTLELGYDNIFFPGGTRSRAGSVEGRLKLGLLGSGLVTYVENLKKKVEKPNLYVVPCTLSYELTLEAETLIDDFLKDVGKSRYIISDDEFSQPRRVLDFVTSLLSLESRIYVTVSRPLDPFGNPVDEAGHSLDPMGRRIDTTRYVVDAAGDPVTDDARDAEYTREVGERVTEAFLRDNVLMSTHLLARAVFGLLRKHNPKRSLIRLIRGGGEHEDVEMVEVYEVIERLLGELRALALSDGVKLDPRLDRARAEDVVAEGLRHFATYHTTPAVTRRGDRIFASDRNLIFYYQNRVEGYGVWPEPELPPALSRDRRSLGGAR